MRITTIVCIRNTRARLTIKHNASAARVGRYVKLPFLPSKLNRIDRDASKNYTPPMQTHFQEYPPPALPPFLELLSVLRNRSSVI